MEHVPEERPDGQGPGRAVLEVADGRAGQGGAGPGGLDVELVSVDRTHQGREDLRAFVLELAQLGRGGAVGCDEGRHPGCGERLLVTAHHAAIGEEQVGRERIGETEQVEDLHPGPPGVGLVSDPGSGDDRCVQPGRYRGRETGDR